MTDEKDSKGTQERFNEGYQPLKKGYYPTEGGLDRTNAPQGGSGMPSSSSNDSGEKAKE